MESRGLNATLMRIGNCINRNKIAKPIKMISEWSRFTKLTGCISFARHPTTRPSVRDSWSTKNNTRVTMLINPILSYERKMLITTNVKHWRWLQN